MNHRRIIVSILTVIALFSLPLPDTFAQGTCPFGSAYCELCGSPTCSYQVGGYNGEGQYVVCTSRQITCVYSYGSLIDLEVFALCYLQEYRYEFVFCCNNIF